jgi:hypothetical protein
LSNWPKKVDKSNCAFFEIFRKNSKNWKKLKNFDFFSKKFDFLTTPDPPLPGGVPEGVSRHPPRRGGSPPPPVEVPRNLPRGTPSSFCPHLVFPGGLKIFQEIFQRPGGPLSRSVSRRKKFLTSTWQFDQDDQNSPPPVVTDRRPVQNF